MNRHTVSILLCYRDILGNWVRPILGCLTCLIGHFAGTRRDNIRDCVSRRSSRSFWLLSRLQSVPGRQRTLQYHQLNTTYRDVCRWLLGWSVGVLLRELERACERGACGSRRCRCRLPAPMIRDSPKGNYQRGKGGRARIPALPFVCTPGSALLLPPALWGFWRLPAVSGGAPFVGATCKAQHTFWRSDGVDCRATGARRLAPHPRKFAARELARGT